MAATKPAIRDPVTWSQNLGTCPQIGNQPAWLFPFFPTSATARAADIPEHKTKAIN